MRAETRSAIREARRRPAADWWNAGDRSHSVQFYSDDAVLVELLSRFVGTALIMGDAAVVLATKRHRDAVSMRLRRRGLDTTVAREQGRYVVADAAQLLDKFASKGRVSRDDVQPASSAGCSIARRAPRVAPGTAWPFSASSSRSRGQSEQQDAAMRIEELWNELASARKFSLCCAYPMTGFAANAHAPSFIKILRPPFARFSCSAHCPHKTNARGVRRIMWRMAEPLIRDVSDTARWVAVYRARESERPDAVFRDPYARRLAGERGEQIANAIPFGQQNAWSWTARTYLVDRLIAAHVARRR